jgi:pimeloyl-ACP methyl ester carboxylesterase
MATGLEYAKIADIVYSTNPQFTDPPLTDWHRVEGGFHQSTAAFTGAFQGVALSKGAEVVIAFKGTATDGSTTKRDVLADFMLGFGMNTSHYTRATEFVTSVLGRGFSRISLCGHSLGGAIAQVMGNRFRLPFVTFNAPGVALLSRNLDEVAQTFQTGTAKLRAVGAAASALVHPVQAVQDAVALFHRTRGANLRLPGELVSRVGVHFGRVIDVPALLRAPDEQHKIGTMIYALEHEGAAYGRMRLEELIG